MTKTAPRDWPLKKRLLCFALPVWTVSVIIPVFLAATAGPEAAVTWAAFFWCLFVYFAPSSIAWWYRHHNRRAIYAANLFLGWTLVGWLLLIIWAFTAPRKVVYIKNGDQIAD